MNAWLKIPTFDLEGRHLVHFAGYERHVGFYPTGSGIAAFADELKAYKRGKGSVQFPLGRPLPIDLIRRIVCVRFLPGKPARRRIPNTVGLFRSVLGKIRLQCQALRFKRGAQFL